MTNANDPAFTGPTNSGFTSGLTKREYFAAVALQGLSVEGSWSKAIAEQVESEGSNTSEAIAVFAVNLADELIEALNK